MYTSYYGMSCNPFLKEVREQNKFESNDYKELINYYFHGVSHSIGLDTHDPFLRSQPLPVNAVISNEPGLYFKEYNIGIRIEDDILIKENKAINLSKSIIKGVAQIERFMKR